MRDILRIGQSRPIDEKEIYDVTDGLQCEKNTRELSALWQQQLITQKPSLSMALFKWHGMQILLWSLLVVFFDLCSTLVYRNLLH